MAKFYGTVKGSHGEATREGTSSSGIRSSVQSHQGSCIVSLQEHEDKLILSIDTAPDSRSNMADRKFFGTFKDFNKLMDLVYSMGTNKAIEVLSKK